MTNPLPQNVAQLRDEAKRKMIDFAEEVWQAGREGFNTQTVAPCRHARESAEAAIDALASLASSPTPSDGVSVSVDEAIDQLCEASKEACTLTSSSLAVPLNEAADIVRHLATKQEATQPAHTPVLEYSAEDLVAEGQKWFKRGFEAGEKHGRSQATQPVPAIPADTELLDYLQTWADRSKSIGFKWDNFLFRFDASFGSVRQQIAAARAQAQDGGEHEGN